ncbi:uncharacterized protein EV154DRAFT_488604 [Mucor mucedo]|uniref:uncharacterized protein n=1 Tax=Mucor mucedo TaxID=29922 RepID=UPI00222025F1|nr:uncharacterized protein EV154DRAFT_488601 [Mucor mucedo]XP_051450331.1 uncharacterized protein EV154DRAFT_488604 [Mucor mucedo]KAI7866110.1 hypothetical protein EV154DRAFT_488601 [Mucor mucedo]KAI7866112.1 hypothetical protein EV154DRAFT_488604 [Mucor mucedo]
MCELILSISSDYISGIMVLQDPTDNLSSTSIVCLSTNMQIWEQYNDPISRFNKNCTRKLSILVFTPTSEIALIPEMLNFLDNGTEKDITKSISCYYNVSYHCWLLFYSKYQYSFYVSSSKQLFRELYAANTRSLTLSDLGPVLSLLFHMSQSNTTTVSRLVSLFRIMYLRYPLYL